MQSNILVIPASPPPASRWRNSRARLSYLNEATQCPEEAAARSEATQCPEEEELRRSEEEELCTEFAMWCAEEAEQCFEEAEQCSEEEKECSEEAEQCSEDIIMFTSWLLDSILDQAG